eukprot:10107962-Ditylum_brightwellii.AAC.1
MRGVFVLLSKDISKVEITSHLMDSNKVSLDRFLNSIFMDLNMTEAFSQQIGGPIDTGTIVIENWYGIRKKGGLEVEVINDVGDMLKGFDTFISSIDFSFTETVGCDGLTMTMPVDGTVGPKEET